MWCIINCRNAIAAGLDKSDFASIVNFQESGEVWLVGKFKAGIKLTSLLLEPPYTCSAETTSRSIVDDSSGTELTEIVSSCKVVRGMIAILRKPVLDYKLISLKKITDATKILTIDQKVKNSNILQRLTEKAQDNITGDVKWLRDVSPEIHQFSMPKANVMIVSYMSLSEIDERANPRIIIINNHVYPFTGWCSWEDMNVFRLNGQYYVQSGSMCCGCGITIEEVYQITPNGLVQVIFDNSFSN
jgi:hypothetical protein